MFGKKKDKPSGEKAPSNAKAPAADNALRQSFTDAKEATRRATFLYSVAQLPGAAGELVGPLKAMFDACRAKALSIGERLGVSAAEIDAELAAMCDADADRLARGSQQEAEAYTRESGAIVQRFLATVKPGAPN
jgi:hypothetical protein